MDDGPNLCFFSATAQLTGATDATLDGLHLEILLPADASTRTLLTSSITAHPYRIAGG
ncbi:MAG: hypothetical protein ACRCXL_06670 [Dermatophilaceae bacterium]